MVYNNKHNRLSTSQSNNTNSFLNQVTVMPFTYTNPEELYSNCNELKKEDVAHLQEWIRKQSHLPLLNETEIIFFLHSCYFSIEKTKITVEKHFTSKTAACEIFGKRSPDEFQECMNQGVYVPLPKLTPEGYQLLVCKLNCDPNDYIFYNHLKYIDVCLKTWFLERVPPEGFIVIVDMDGYLFGHLTKIPLTCIKKLAVYYQEGLPVRLKAIHFINIVSFIDKVLSLIKPFMKMEIMNMLHFHSRNDDLYKYVPQTLLPKDYGGNEDSLDKLHETNKNRINDKLDYLEIDESKWTDESKRQDKSNNIDSIFGVEGSFKKLELD